MKTTDFTTHPEVVSLLDQLKASYRDEPLIVSDVVDAKGNQYVNLVQEGGGVLGVALVGYTYVLEQMGIRFFRLAGTSAGAINTMMLAAIGEKDEPKSERVLDYIVNKNLFDFVDGDPAARRLIKMMVTNKTYARGLVTSLIVAGVAFAALLLLSCYFLGGPSFTWYAIGTYSLTVLAGLFLANRIWWLYDKLHKFYHSGYGINPGNNFLEWITGVLRDNGIQNLEDLERKAYVRPDTLQLRPESMAMRSDADATVDDLHPDITLIASDITNQIKIEFPKMWNLYWTDKKQVNPGMFVRASMSVPVFFESFKVEVPTKAPSIALAWNELTNRQDTVASLAMFVDGGVISNFPINIFFNPNIRVPRLPTFGILLDEGDDRNLTRRYSSFLSYIMAMFNTVRFYYDKDFLLKHNDFEKTIGRIDVKGFNWLNFNITDEEKTQLFLRGVRAAVNFLMPGGQGVRDLKGAVRPRAKKGFSWDNYKVERADLCDRLTGKH